MSCCGRQRQQYQASAQTHQTSESASIPAQPRTVRDSVAYFEYTGKTTLTVIGSVTGKYYRFPAPGAIVAVDQLDRVTVAAVPNLRQVRNPYGASSI